MKKIILIIFILLLFILGDTPKNINTKSNNLRLNTEITQFTNIKTLSDTSTLLIIKTKTLAPSLTKNITITTINITLTPIYLYSKYEPKIELGSIGSVLPVTKEQVCNVNYPLTVKEISIKIKEQVFLLYNISFNPRNTNRYETDYIVSSDLGGSSNIDNLWVQSYYGLWTAYDKDKLKVHLHRLVCNGIIDLDKAQKMMSNHWVSNYIRYFGNPYK